MADKVQTIRFTQNAKDSRSSVPYVAGQEATVLSSVADRLVKAGVAKEVRGQSAEAAEDPRTVETLREQASAKNVEGVSSLNKTQLIAALK